MHVRDTGNTLIDGTSRAVWSVSPAARPLPDNAVARLFPEAFVSPLIQDAQRKPIDASPHRRFPMKLRRRFLDERSVGCAHPGCHAQVLRQADHVVAYDDGGSTIIDNLQLLCGPRNRAKDQVRAEAGAVA